MSTPTTHPIPSENSVWLKRIAFGFWALFVVVVIVKCLLAPHVHSVYPEYAAAGRIWWFPGNEANPGVYGPFFGQLIGPFCALPNELGGALWYVFSFLVFLSGLYKFLKRVLPELNNKTISIFFLLVPWCGIASLYNGQANLILAGCFLWATVAILADRWWLAGFALAVPVGIKAYPIAVAMIFIGLYPKKLLPKFILALIVLLCLPFVFHKPDFVLQRYEIWLHYLTSGTRYSDANWVYVDLRAFLARWLVTISPRNYIPVQVITGLLVGLCVYIRRRSSQSKQQTLLYAYILTSIWLVLFGPASEEATYLLVSPAVCWLLIDAYRQKKIMPIVYLTIAALFVGPFQTSVLGEPFRKWTLAQKIAPLALTIFFLHQIARLFPPRVTENQEKN